MWHRHWLSNGGRLHFIIFMNLLFWRYRALQNNWWIWRLCSSLLYKIILVWESTSLWCPKVWFSTQIWSSLIWKKVAKNICPSTLLVFCNLITKEFPDKNTLIPLNKLRNQRGVESDCQLLLHSLKHLGLPATLKGNGITHKWAQLASVEHRWCTVGRTVRRSIHCNGLWVEVCPQISCNSN